MGIKRRERRDRGCILAVFRGGEEILMVEVDAQVGLKRYMWYELSGRVERTQAIYIRTKQNLVTEQGIPAIDDRSGGSVQLLRMLNITTRKAHYASWNLANLAHQPR